MNYDSFLPVIDLAKIADDAGRLIGYKMFYKGFGIIGLGLLMKQVANLTRVMRNKDADFVTPIVQAAAFIALIAFYKPFVTTTISVVSTMGLTEGWDNSVATSFVTRSAQFVRWRQEHGTIKGYPMEFLVGLLYLLVEGWIVFLRAAQSFVLAVIVTYGPLLLGVASLGGTFLPLGLGWFLAMIEVSAWSITMDVLLVGYSKMKHVPKPEDISVDDEFVFSAVMLALIVCVPAFTSWLVRSGSGAFLSSSVSTVTRSITMFSTSRFARDVNKAAYDTAKSGIKQTATWGRGKWQGSSAPAARATPASSWSAADAVAGYRESRATSARSQATGGGTSAARPESRR